MTALCLKLALAGNLAAAIEGLWQLGGLGGDGGGDLERTKLVTCSTLLAAMVRERARARAREREREREREKVKERKRERR